MSRISSIVGPSGERLLIDEQPPQVSNWWRHFEAGDRRDFRGWFYFPKLSLTSQLDNMTDRAIRERAHWLYNNVAPFGMAVDSIASDDVGTGLWPKWDTDNSEFNKEVTDAYHFVNRDPRFFSGSGMQDAYSVQFNIRRMIYIDGDCFGQFIRANSRPAGFGSQYPCVHLIPGYLVENYGDEEEGSGWTRGIRSDPLGRPIEYRVLNGEEKDGYHDVPAEDMLHFVNPVLAGQSRGVSIAASIAKKMFRREDVIKAMGNGTLSREMLGFAIECDSDIGPGPAITLPGARQVTEETPVESSTQNVSGQQAKEKKEKSKFTIQQFFGYDQQERVVVPELRNGAKFKMLESSRPGTAVLEMLDYMLREVAWAARRSPEYVFFIAAGRQGTNVRLMLQKENATSLKAREFQLKPQFMQRWPTFWVWNAMIRPGRVKAVVPDNWWKYKITPLPDTSVDIGREGRLYDERVESNKMSISTYHGLNGEDPDDVEDENHEAIRRRCRKINKLNQDADVRELGERFGYFDVYPRQSSFARDVGGGAVEDTGEPGQNGKNGKNGNKPANRRRKRQSLNGNHR